MAIREVLTEAANAIWKEWSPGGMSFHKESDMQLAFAGALEARLPRSFSVSREANLDLRRRISAWTKYDIAVRDGGRLVGLFELSCADTNLAHALHNGELKLLGSCVGVGTSSGRSYADERALCEDDVVTVNRALSAIPVRGLFFVNPGPKLLLDLASPAVWWETKAKGFAGETRFWSSLMSPERTATLRDAFGKLAGAGVSCWFYSLCGEEPLAYPSIMGSHQSPQLSPVT